jgi:hypothetical protein
MTITGVGINPAVRNTDLQLLQKNRDSLAAVLITSASAQRWKQIKAGLKLIGQRRRPDNAVDNKKSAEFRTPFRFGRPDDDHRSGNQSGCP